MEVIPNETICRVVSAVTGLNIRCSAPHCPAWDDDWKLCDIGERPLRLSSGKAVPFPEPMVMNEVPGQLKRPKPPSCIAHILADLFNIGLKYNCLNCGHKYCAPHYKRRKSHRCELWKPKE